MNKQQTTGAYADIRTTDLILMDVLDVAALSQVEKRIILNLFNEIKNIEFPSILGQLENRFKARVKLDKTILKILRFSDEEINEWIPKIYDALVEELKAIKEIR